MRPARRYGVHYISRSLFLNNARDPAAAYGAFLRLIDRQADPHSGPLLVIGHFYRNTVRVLKEVLPLLQNEGVEFVSGLAH